MRVLSHASGGDGGGHSHAHSHSHGGHNHSQGTSSAVSKSEGELRKRKNGDAVCDANEVVVEDKKQPNASLRLSAYLNLFGDFTHNITDGLAMAASFYSSPALGAVTTIATFCHEIPHEVADYSILIKSGFTKRQAMGSQFFTAVGAFVGTFLGIWIAETAGVKDNIAVKPGQGLFGTTATGAELVIPMTAGGEQLIC